MNPSEKKKIVYKPTKKERTINNALKNVYDVATLKGIKPGRKTNK